MSERKPKEDSLMDSYNSDSSGNIRLIVLLSAIMGAIALIVATA